MTGNQVNRILDTCYSALCFYFTNPFLEKSLSNPCTNNGLSLSFTNGRIDLNIFFKLTFPVFKVISGYTTPGLRLAVENGEVEGVCGVTWETHMASVPYWILDRKVNFILQLGLRENSNLKGVPLALASISDPQDRKVFELLNTPLEFARPILAPPGVPDDRLEALRGAFAATMDDSAYLADANRAKQFPDPMSAKQALDLLNRAYESPKEVIARATVYAASGD